MARTELPTRRQKKLVKLLVGDNGTKSKAELLADAGYSPAIQYNPQKVFRSEGVQKLLAMSEEIVSDADCILAIKKAIDSDDLQTVAKTALAWLRFKYPEQWRPTNNTINNTQINISSVEEGAYLFFCDKFKLTREEIDRRLS